MPATRFFPDAHLNVAENLLVGWAGDEPAIISHDETGHREECSGSALVRDVAALRRGAPASSAWSPATGWRRGCPTGSRR